MAFLLLAPAQAEWKNSINADFTAEAMHWNHSLLADKNQTHGIFTLKTPATLKNGRTLRFRFLPWLQYDPSGATKYDQFFWDMQEGYMQLQSLPWTLQLGWNVQTWGDTDVFNPLDVVNARRYQDPFRAEKLGAATVLLKREWESFFVEAIYIPRQRETYLPGTSSRWLPRTVYKSRKIEGTPVGSATLSGVVNLPSDVRYNFNKPTVLSAALNDNFGARVKFRLEGFDWTIAGFQGAATTPSVNLDTFNFTNPILPGATALDITVAPDVWLKATYYKTRMLGTSFVKVLGNVLLKGASAHTNVLSSAAEGVLPKESWENVLGAEFTFGLGGGAMTVLGQGTYIGRKEKLDTNSVSLARMFDRAAMTGLRWSPSDRFAVLASLLHDLHYQGDLVHADVSYKIADGWIAKAGGDLLSGRPETPIGTYGANDRVYISINLQK
ncbi:MAG TPA: hypothetical protein VIH99_12340 [Bdellovibrionota bacterium]